MVSFHKSGERCQWTLFTGKGRTGRKPLLPSNYLHHTSCVVKSLARIINQHIQWYLETENILVPEKSDFRQFHSAEDQAAYLSQEVEDTFQEQKLVFATRIEVQKVFDKVLFDGLIIKLQRSISENMLSGIRTYCHNRGAKVTAYKKESKRVLLRHGVRQVGVIIIIIITQPL